jgi:hypothetical protein
LNTNAGLGRHLDGLDRGVAVGPHRDRGRPVEGRGPDLDQQVGQAVDADLAGGRPHDHGEDGGGGQAVVQGALELVDARHVAVEVALEQGVVGHHDALDQVVVDLVLELLHVVGDGFGAGHPALVDVGGVGEQVGDAPEAGLLPDGQLQRGDAGAEPVAQLGQGGVVAGPLAVELVDEDHAGQAEAGGQRPRLLGLDLDPVDRADHEHGQVGDAQGGGHVAHEVGVARRVDEVDLVVAPLERSHRQRQGDAALVLLGVEVAHRRPVLDATHAGDGTGPVQEGLCQARLARSAVPDQGDVADLTSRVPLHQAPPSVDGRRSGRG